MQLTRSKVLQSGAKLLRNSPLILSLLMSVGCDSPPPPPINYDGLVTLPEPDVTPPQEDQDVSMVDRGPVTQEDMNPPPIDMEVPEDMSPPRDMNPSNPLDGDIPMGDPCDPRLRAVACDPGFSCIPVPGGRVNQGRCVEGDGCALTGVSGCPEDLPYCHLRGRATECTQPGELGLGEACLDEFNRSLPCAEGLVCNFSICVPPCDPTGDIDAQCGQGKSCVDLTDQLGQIGGFCGPVAACDYFSGGGCTPEQQCEFAVRADDQEIVYFCTNQGNAEEGEACSLSGAGADACAQGLICISSPEGDYHCKRVCDTGAYQGPCPDGQSCREILSQGGGVYIRSLGICVINP